MRVKEESEKADLKFNIQKAKIMASSPITSWQIGQRASRDRFSFLGLHNHCGAWLQPWNQKTHASWKESHDKPRQCINNQTHHFVDKGLYSQSCGFSSSHVRMWDLHYKEGWALKNLCFWIVMLEKTLENPLDCKEIKSVDPKGNQHWIFTGRTDTEAEAPLLQSSVAKWLEKALMLGKIKGKEKGAAEDEMVRKHHWIDGYEFEQTPQDTGGQQSLTWGHNTEMVIVLSH